MKRKYSLWLDVGFLALLPLAALLAKWMLGALPDCPVMKAGLLCPACGGTRCLLQLTKGNFLQALRYNAYFFFTAWLLFGLLVLGNVWALTHGKKGGVLLKKVLRPRWIVAWAIGFALFGILRNLLIIWG